MSDSATRPADVVLPQVAKKNEPLYEEVRDGYREFFETISFVVFLVLMLKAFVAEAYVIPTGSMATTLLGDHMHLECPRCKQKYTVNASHGGQHLEQGQPDGSRKMLKVEGCCPNCQYVISNTSETIEGGDKVLVLKPIYDMFAPVRHDTVVFKYPLSPQKDFGAYNYIKRLWGLPGEKLALWGGDVYLVENDQLKIIRKPPDKMLRMRRMVNDNDLLNPSFNPPWVTSWSPLNDKLEPTPGEQSAWEPANNGIMWASRPKEGAVQWLRYQHQFEPVRMGGAPARFQQPVQGPHLITNYMAYNHAEGQSRFQQQEALDWVGDLMVEAEVEVQDTKGQFVLQLKKGVINAEASFNLESGQCTVVLMKDGKEVSKHEASTSINSKSKHLVRFANFDQRLTLWVGSKLIFGNGIEYADLKDTERGPRLADFVPVSLGAQNARTVVRKLSIWRDIYYPRDPNELDASVNQDALMIKSEELRDLAKQGELHSIQRAAWLAYYPAAVKIGNDAGGMGMPRYYPKVDASHPSDRFNADEYFMLGDNSLSSEDSRRWGQVPQRMLLGRAILVYWPWRSFATIR